MSEWTTLDRTIAYRCDGFDVINETVALPDGTRTAFDYLSENPSVIILPFTPTGEVVVIDEWRHAVGRENRGLPAGSLEAGEDPADAVERELREETGYEPGRVEKMTTMEPTNGFADTEFHYFLARDCREVAEQSLDDDETITVDTTTMEEMVSAIESGSIRDGRSAYGICYYKLFVEE